LIYNNGNKGGVFATSIRTDDMLEETRKIISDFINADSTEEIIFGPNFTSLTFSISRALARTWSKGDEIIVSRLDHDANVSPWVLAAQDAGVKVNYIDIEEGTCKLKMDEFSDLLTERTKLVAVCAGSSSVGTTTDIKLISTLAHRVASLVYVDAVAYAPHRFIDVKEWKADFVGFSTYKFFGPHVGVLWGKRELLMNLSAYKIRPAPELLPDKWMNGAQSYETIAGARAAIEYISYIGEKNIDQNSFISELTGLKASIRAGMLAIEEYETILTWKFINEIKNRPYYKLWGVKDPSQKEWRLPTIAISLGNEKSIDIARFLAENNIYIWSRSVYSISLSERLGLEKTGGFIRVGFVHYNTEDEMKKLISLLDKYYFLSSGKIN
jgi:cysteine desulfurase family protein (TIGR01976 family)